MPRGVFPWSKRGSKKGKGRAEELVLEESPDAVCSRVTFCSWTWLIFGQPTSAAEAQPVLQTRGNPVSSPNLSKDVQPFGLKLLLEGTDPVVDIVAVHGLNGHREETWTATNGVNWLEDKNMLPAMVRNARIYTWGYDASTHGRRSVTNMYLDDYGRRLVMDLADERKATGVIFSP
jgi:hypothetical protein